MLQLFSSSFWHAAVRQHIILCVMIEPIGNVRECDANNRERLIGEYPVMTPQLQQAIERLQHLQHLLAEEQDVIAKRILEEIDEWEWDRIVSSPRGQQVLLELDDEAQQQEERGEIEEGGFGAE
jgi:hypothetical protein